MFTWRNPGRLPSLLHLFDHHVLKIWRRLQIAQVGFWTVLAADGSNDLNCCISWNRWPIANERWAAFEADPEWQRVRAEANKDGPVFANIDVKPTSFSALK